MLKKLLLMFLAVLLVFSLAACGTDALYQKKNTENTAETETVEEKSVSSYQKNIDGVEQCLIDRGLLTDAMVEAKASMLYNIIGAEDGYRYTLNSNAFVEIYKYAKVLNATADEIKSSIDSEGTFSIAEMDPLTGVYSSDGQFLLVYNSGIKYDHYDDIAEVIKQF